MNINLKSCPFCGGGPVWEYYTVGVWDEPEDRWNVTCDTCGITFEKGFKTRKEAIDAWNRRAVALFATTPEVRTAKVEAQYTVGDHGKVYDMGVCGACGAPVIKPDVYCSECGVRLDWSE